MEAIVISDVSTPSLIEIIKENKKLEDRIVANLVKNNICYIKNVIEPIKKFITVTDSQYVRYNIDFNNKKDMAEFMVGIQCSQKNYNFISKEDYASIEYGFTDINQFNNFIIKYTSSLQSWLTYWHNLKHKNIEKYFELLAENVIDSYEYDDIYLIDDEVVVVVYE